MDHPENSEEYKGLQVNAGVTSQSIVNPYLKRGRFRRHEYSAAEMVEGILKGDVTILSQAVTLVDEDPKTGKKKNRKWTFSAPFNILGRDQGDIDWWGDDWGTKE